METYVVLAYRWGDFDGLFIFCYRVKLNNYENGIDV